MDTMSKDHERIWLQPDCCADPYDGRMWCEHQDGWGDCDDGVPSTEYVRADLFQAQAARIAELEAEKDELLRHLLSSSMQEVIDAAYEQGAKDMRERAGDCAHSFDDGESPVMIANAIWAIPTQPEGTNTAGRTEG